MKLSELLGGLPPTLMIPFPVQDTDPVPAGACTDPAISAIDCDSRHVGPGSLFVAIPGVDRDGHQYIPDALRRGAIAVVGQEPNSKLLPDIAQVPYFRVSDSRQALAWLSAAWYGNPGRKMRVVGVTGTDGKTTTVRLVSAVLSAAGYRVGWISTVNAQIGNEQIDTGLHTTTPDAPDVQCYLAQMVQAGTQYAVVEATSHGLAQHRVAACEFDVAAVTNITREHLDYHHTFEDYRAAKGALFRGLSTSFRKSGTPKVAILNVDDPSFDYLRALCPQRCFTYGLQVPGDITAKDIQLSPTGTCFEAVIPGGSFQVRTPLPGMFNVYNILATIAVGFSQGVPAEAMQQGILSVIGVAGRMERIDVGQGFSVLVDFAHTPNALQSALQTARTLTRGKLIVVFGCAGLRDRSKRARMGQVAGRLADYAFLTAEDPRTEDVNAIIAEIAAGCLSSGRREGVDYWRVPDRSDAIARAINLARSGDLVIITGKGHEQSMCFGTTEYPWSDHEAARAALRAAPSSD